MLNSLGKVQRTKLEREREREREGGEGRASSPFSISPLDCVFPVPGENMKYYDVHLAHAVIPLPVRAIAKIDVSGSGLNDQRKLRSVQAREWRGREEGRGEGVGGEGRNHRSYSVVCARRSRTRDTAVTLESSRSIERRERASRSSWFIGFA